MIILLSALLHELGHLLVITLYGQKAKIKLSPIGFVITKSGECNYVSDIIISLAGPFVNAAVFFMLVSANTLILKTLAYSSLALAIINLLPIKALDGGSALFSLMCIFASEEKAERTLTTVSNITVGIVFIFAVCLMLTRDANFTLLLLCVWLFYNINIKKI